MLLWLYVPNHVPNLKTVINRGKFWTTSYNEDKDDVPEIHPYQVVSEYLVVWRLQAFPLVVFDIWFQELLISSDLLICLGRLAFLLWFQIKVNYVFDLHHGFFLVIFYWGVFGPDSSHLPLQSLIDLGHGAKHIGKEIPRHNIWFLESWRELTCLDRLQFEEFAPLIHLL